MLRPTPENPILEEDREIQRGQDMALNPTVMQAVEKLDYRVTVGDVATSAGLQVNLAERELLALASEAGGHLQVADTGDIVYQFPKQFRAILRNKYFRIQLQEWWEKVWRILFYLIRISFGIILILSIFIIFASIFILLTMANKDSSSNRSRSRGGGMIFFPRMFWGPDIFWFFSPNYGRYQRQRRQKAQASSSSEESMNFLESVFSFLFGDGNPNANLEERRWQAIAATIRNHQGAVVAEQIAPYLDDLGTGYSNEYEDYMLPVLTRFNGRPEVSPDGQIVYHFPELQTTVQQRNTLAVPAYLRELTWKFSEASSSQLSLAAGLGVLNIGGGIFLGYLLQDGAIAAQIGGLVAFAASIYWLLIGYGVAFLSVPLIRYFWLKGRNRQVEVRNEARQEQAIALNQPSDELRQKLAYAQQFAAQNIIGSGDIAYTTETDLIEQESQNSAKLDAEWRKRLEG